MVRDARLPFTVLLPDTRLQPNEIHDHSVSLRMCLVEKDTVHLLDDTWDATGAYVLLDPIIEDGTFGVYVGKAPAGIRSRLLSHERTKQWARALLIQRDGRHGLSSAQAGWLEGDLYDLFTAAERARLHNNVKPGDDTVPSYDVRILESFRDPIVRVLRLLGYDPATADDQATDATRPRRRGSYHGITVADLIAAGLLASGEQLVSTNTSWPASASVTAEGCIECLGDVVRQPVARCR